MLQLLIIKFDLLDTGRNRRYMDWIALSFILPVCLFPWSSDTACYVSVALIQIISCPSPASHSLIKINWNSFNISKFGILSPVSACQQLQAAWPLFTQTQTAAAWPCLQCCSEQRLQEPALLQSFPKPIFYIPNFFLCRKLRTFN